MPHDHLTAVVLPKNPSRLERELAAEHQTEVLRFTKGEDPHPSNILRTRSRPEHRLGELYHWMLERDTDLAAYCAKLVDAVLALPRTIEPAEPATPQAQEAARFVRWALGQIPDLRTALEHLAYGQFFGLAIVELFWQKVQDGGEFSGAWAPVKAVDRPLWRFLFKGGQLHVRRPNGQHLLAPGGKFLLHRWGCEDSPWGKPLLDQCYWLHWTKIEVLKFFAIHLERFASPSIWVKYPWLRGEQHQSTNESTQAQALAVAASLSQELAAALPEGMEVDSLETGHSGAATYQQYLDLANRGLAVRILGETQTSGLDSKTGSYNSYAVSDAIRLEKVARLAHSLATALRDHLFRPLVELNLGTGTPVPRLHIQTVEAEDRRLRQEGIDRALAAGQAVPRAYFLRTHQVPEPREGEPVVLRGLPPVTSPPPSQPPPPAEAPRHAS